jgi:long-chain fatty acid transport protein
MKKQVIAASLLLSSVTSFGAGYQLNLQGVRQLAMGGTGVAWPWDASTIFYNPGGMGRMKSIQAYVSGELIVPSTAFGNEQSSAVTQAQTFAPFNAYIGGPMQEDSRFALGLGIYTVAGIGLKWDDQWAGRYLVKSITLKAICFQPTISYRVSDFLSVGAGFVYSTGSLDLSQALPVHGTYGPGGSTDDEGSVHLKGTANGVGFNLGVQLKTSDNLQFGLTYRSQINLGVSSGTATFTVPGSLASSFPNTHFDSQLPLPQVATAGVGYRTSDERLTLQFDLNYTGWNSYDSLRINFAEHTSALKDMHAPRHYRNTLTPRAGINYKLGKVVSLMAGGAFEPTPVTNGFVSPDLPDADRIVGSLGVSIKPFPRFTILTAWEGISTITRNASYNYGGFSGTYKTEAATLALGFYYNF